MVCRFREVASLVRDLLTGRETVHSFDAFLESGKLQLTLDEAASYQAAADRLHEACDMALDLMQRSVLTTGSCCNWHKLDSPAVSECWTKQSPSSRARVACGPSPISIGFSSRQRVQRPAGRA